MPQARGPIPIPAYLSMVCLRNPVLGVVTALVSVNTSQL
jgi:hypothetical protein